MEIKSSIYLLFGNISAYGIIIPLCISIFRLKHLNQSEKFIFLLFLLGTLTELTSEIYIAFVKLNNLYLLNTYQILETIVITLFYFKLTHNKVKKTILLLFIFMFIGIGLYHLILNGNKTLSNYCLTIESLAIISFVLLSFHSIFKKEIYTNLLDVPLFWFNCAFLIYFAGNIYLHLFSQYLISHAQYAFFELWGLWHSLFSIIFYILISIGLWKTKKSQI
jgi:hypothetical protein